MGAQTTLPGAPFRQGTCRTATQATAPFADEQEPPSRGTPSWEANGAVPVEESEAGGNQLVPHAGPPERCTPGRARPAGIGDLTAARAEALFASDLSQWASPATAEVAAAIRHALRVFGGTRGCAGEVAAAYGEHPETAAPRMRWALQVVQDAFPRPCNRRRKRRKTGEQSMPSTFRLAITEPTAIDPYRAQEVSAQ